VKKVFRILGYATVIVLFLIAILAGMTQTGLFKEWVRQIAEQQAAEHLNGELMIGSIGGTFVTGITLENVIWRYDGETAIGIRSLRVDLNPLRLLQREIHIQNLVLMEPSVHLIADKHGALNISNLVKKRDPAAHPEADTARTDGPRRWVYRLDNLDIHSGSFRLSKTADTGGHRRSYPVDFETINFGDLRIGNLYLTMSAVSDGRNHSFNIRSMNFSVSDPTFSVSHLSLQGALSPVRSQVNRLRLITDRSNINVTAGISDYNLLGGNEGRIEEKDMEVRLFADRIHFDDLKMFIPALWFLEGSVAIEVAAGGSIDAIDVHSVDLQFGSTNIGLAGGVMHTTRGNELFIDAAIADSRIDPADVNSLLPYFGIPDYRHIGIFDFDASYTGRPKDFTAAVDLHTSAGGYAGELELDLTGDRLVYDGSVVARNADVAALLQQTLYPYDLDGRITLQGSGTRLDELSARAHLDIAHMKLGNLSFDSLDAGVHARGYELGVISSGFLEGSRFYIDAVAGVEDIGTGPFNLRLAFESLDLARVLEDTSYSSDLTFSLSASGEGLLPERMLGEIAIELEPSRFRDYDFIGDPVYISLEEIAPDVRELNIRSEIMDVYLAGVFDLPTVLGISYEQIRDLIDAVRGDIRNVVTGDYAAAGRPSVRETVSNPLDALYDIDIKSMDAVAILLGRDAYEVEVEGKLYGYLKAAESIVQLGGNIEIGHFLFLSETDRLLFDSIEGRYNIDNDYSRGGLEGIYSEFDIAAVGIYTESISFHNARLKGDLRGADWTVYSRALVDTVFAYEIDAAAHFDSTSMRTELATLALKYNGLQFANRDILTLRYDRAGILFEDFILYHNDLSTVGIEGVFSPGGEHDIHIALNNLQLEEVHRIASPETVRRRQPLFRGSVDIIGAVSGTTRQLNSRMEVKIREMAYGELEFGRIDGSLAFAGDRLQFRMDIAEAGDTERTAFLLNGDMPFALFPGDGERIPDGPINVHIFSEGFDLSIADPFLGEFRGLRGKMTSDVSITGTVEDPLYDGNLVITEGSFTMAANDVSYNFTARLEPRQNELVLSQLRIENRRRDLPDGRMDFRGTIQTRGLTIREFDLSAEGQLKVMRMGSRRAGDMFYGDLTIATGTGGIRLAGTVEESRLHGTVLIRSASLIFPPVRASAYERTGSIVNYIVIEDAEEDTESLSPLELFFRDVARSHTEERDREQSQGRFLDGLDYDVTIQTDGRVEMTMIFNQAMGEELTARLETTSLRLYRDELANMRLIGNVELVEPSAYSFYRRFDARGRISFVGPPDNPEFDITASFTGQRVQVHPAPQDPVAAPVTRAPEQVEVRLHITGDRYEPKLAINLYVDNEERGGDVETDAISYILTGRFQTELESGDYRNISADFGRGIPATFMSGVATSLLSNLFSDFLRNEVRFIRTAEIVWYGGNVMDTAELRISGELRNFYWTIGGRVFNDLGNTNFSFQIPMGPVFNSERWTNLFLELERRSQSIQYSEDFRPVNAARLYYSISF
jgi:hypothetical protein